MTAQVYLSAPRRRKRIERRRRLTVGFAILAATAALVGTGVIASEAHAQPAETARTMPLHYSRHIAYRDLDLNRATDVATLHRRVKHAARNLCIATPAMREAGYAFLPTCYAQALAEGRRQIERAVTVAQNGQKTMLARDDDPATPAAAL